MTYALKRAITIFSVLVFFLLISVGASKNCTTGKPCGNTCINRNYTCRVGNNSPAPVTTATISYIPTTQTQAVIRLVASNATGVTSPTSTCTSRTRPSNYSINSLWTRCYLTVNDYDPVSDFTDSGWVITNYWHLIEVGWQEITLTKGNERLNIANSSNRRYLVYRVSLIN